MCEIDHIRGILQLAMLRVMNDNNGYGKIYGLARFGGAAVRGTEEWQRARDEREAEIRYWRAIWHSQGVGTARRARRGRSWLGILLSSLWPRIGGRAVQS